MCMYIQKTTIHIFSCVMPLYNSYRVCKTHTPVLYAGNGSSGFTLVNYFSTPSQQIIGKRDRCKRRTIINRNCFYENV